MFDPERSSGASPSGDRPIKSVDELLAEEREKQRPLDVEERGALLRRLQEDIADRQSLAMGELAHHLGVDLGGISFHDFQAILDQYYLPKAEAIKKKASQFDRLFGSSTLTQQQVDRELGA